MDSETVRLELENSLFVSTEHDFIPHMIAIIFLFSINALIILGAILLRIRRGDNFWIFKIEVVGKSGRSILLVNAVTLWLFCTTIFHIFMINFSVFYIKATRTSFNLTNFNILRSVSWIPLFIALWGYTFSLAVQPLLKISRVVTSRFDGSRLPLTISFFFTSLPVAFVILVTYFGVKSNLKINALYKLYLRLNQTPHNGSDLQQIVADIAGLNARLTRSWSVTWSIFVAASAIELLVFLPAAWFNFRSIGQSMARVTKASPTPMACRSMKRLRARHRSLAISSLGMTILNFSYLLTASILLRTAASSTSGNPAGLYAELTALYIYGIFGGVTNLTILGRSFAEQQSSRPRDASITNFTAEVPDDRKEVETDKTVGSCKIESVIR